MLTPQAAAGGEMAYQHARPIERASLAGCEMPPVKEAFALIRIAKTAQLAGTGWVYEFLPFQRFTDMCLEVYFNEHHSEANFLTVNAGLHSLFWDYSFHVSAHEREEYVRHSHMCRDNLETALSNLPLHLPATSDMVAALLFGACYAIEISKPNLSWTLSAKASELCQTLGYHRIASMKDDKEEDVRYKRFLLWSIYFIDKCLSLRLGRPSTIPDWDITIPRPSTSDLHSEPVFAYFVLWVEAARCQGNIYEMLYSPNAIAQPNQVRQSRVEALVSDLQNLDIATLETNEKWLRQAKEKSGEDLMDFFYISDHVLRLSLLTLVHRAAPRDPGSLTTFDSNCVAAAIATLQQHEECIAVIRKSTTPYLATYVHWTLLFTPFIPFIVIFCHVIETHDEENLARLQTFVTSIQSAAPVSNPAAKLYRLFDVLCKIASSYLELRISTSQGGPGQGSSKVGAYLDSLGFSSIIGSVPSQQPLGPHQGNPGAVEGFGPYNAEAGAGGAGDGLRAINPLIWAANGADLEDWLQNNEVMTELMQGSETL